MLLVNYHCLIANINLHTVRKEGEFFLWYLRCLTKERGRCRSTPVSTVLQKSVTFFIINMFLIIKTLSKLKSCLNDLQTLERGLNPLSPNSDQDQFSPNNIHTLSRDKLWELIKWSHKRKCLDLLSNSLNSFFKEMYRDQFGEFVCWYWGLKG